MASVIYLPSLVWFLGEEKLNNHNTYTGSWGTDPLTGCMDRPTFHYKVAIQETEAGRKQLVASCYIRPPWGEGAGPMEVQQQAFALSERGLQAAEGFLEEARLAFASRFHRQN